MASTEQSKNNIMSKQLEDREIQEILKSGTDLRQYSQQIEKDLKAVENQSIDEYIKESQNIACLHNQIGDCDNILERMESMLTNFQVIIKLNEVNLMSQWLKNSFIEFSEHFE